MLNNIITFSIPGEPIGKLDHKLSIGYRKNGKPYPTTYKHPKTKAWMEAVSLFARKVAPDEPWTCPVEVMIFACFAPPKSWSAKKVDFAKRGLLEKTSKPDCSNIAKGIEDALTGLIWKDDAQVVYLHVTKYYGAESKTHVSIRPLEATKTREELFEERIEQ